LQRPRDKKISTFENKKFSAIIFFPIFGYQNPRSGTGSGPSISKNVGAGSALNQCGNPDFFIFF
jgi:hypothetical protein